MKLRLDHPFWRRLAPALARGYVRLLLLTTRTALWGDEAGKALLQSEAPVVFALWHCHLLACLYLDKIFCRSKPAIALMASPSRDGEFIGEVARGLGFLVFPGSRHKGGIQALQHLAACMQQGCSTALATDGSRGPARVAQKGVLYLARETQTPIVPVAVANSRKITLNTWDRFEVPLPFGKSALMAAAPLWVSPRDRGDLLEAKRQILESRLNRLFQCSRILFQKP
uniref:DUF374 domain-containing protein n=1 Tax=Desulfobacca acetoxidans TaxID=60893 RepID=A0A7C3V084_9BACT